MDYIFLDTTDSTMSYAAGHVRDLADMTMIVAHGQSAGRGQRGNSWESEPGKNLTVTLCHKPGHSALPLAEHQFRISESAALAVADTLERFGIKACVKWANDVYVGDRKICGILIEHTVCGDRITDSRIGIGLNVNQTEFTSNAPNPVSMARLAGREFHLANVLDALSECLESRLGDRISDIHSEYLSRLWRRDGMPHPFRLRNSSGVSFQATIADVRPYGPLLLSVGENQQLEFYFKEVEFVL